MWCMNCHKEVVATQSVCGDCGKPLSGDIDRDLAIANQASRLFKDQSRSHLRVDNGPGQTTRPEVWPEMNPAYPTDSKENNWLAWSMICLGMMAFTFGAITAGWSLWGHRPDLWHIGFPIFLGGQAILLVGMVLQMNGLWSNQYRTTRTVSELDTQFQHLRRVTMSPGENATNKLVALKKQLDQLGTE